MKKIYTSIFAIALSASIAMAQSFSIPNAGFENWSTSGPTSGKANNWSGYGDMGLILGAPAYTMLTTYFRDQTNKNSGTSSIRITNQNTPLAGDLLGLAWLGTAGTNSANAGIYGIPFSQNIQTFSGFFRYVIMTPNSVDTAVVLCYTTKNGTLDIQDASMFFPTNSTNFTSKSQNAVTINPGVPDTLWILGLSSYWPASDSITSASAGFNSLFWMDDLTLTTITGITAPVLDLVDTRMGPNPANEIIHFSTSALNIGGVVRFYDALGKEVMIYNIEKALDSHINTSNLPNGIYIYKVSDKNGEEKANGKILVSH
jgi:hypothetical protein